MIYLKTPIILLSNSTFTMNFITKYLQQYILFVGLHTAAEIGLSICLIAILILLVVILSYTIFIYYNKILDIQKNKMFQSWTILIVVTCIKNDVLFTKVVLFIQKHNRRLLRVLIIIIRSLRDCLHKFIISLHNNILDVIIYIYCLKLMYAYLKKLIVRINEKNRDDTLEILYDITCDINDIIWFYVSWILKIMFFILVILVILVVYYHIVIVQEPTVITLQIQDYAIN